jgi:hypothetical protein
MISQSRGLQQSKKSMFWQPIKVDNAKNNILKTMAYGFFRWMRIGAP